LINTYKFKGNAKCLLVNVKVNQTNCLT